MKGFIEITAPLIINGSQVSHIAEDLQKRLINVRYITRINPFEGKTAIAASDNNIYIVSETYDEIKKILEETAE